MFIKSQAIADLIPSSTDRPSQSEASRKRPREGTDDSLTSNLPDSNECQECDSSSQPSIADNRRVTHSMRKAARISPVRRRMLGRTQGGSHRHERDELRRTRSVSPPTTTTTSRPMGARPKGFKRGKKWNRNEMKITDNSYTSTFNFLYCTSENWGLVSSIKYYMRDPRRS